MSTEADLKPWLRQSPRRYMLVNHSIFDVEDGSVRENATVKVTHGSIESVEDSAQTTASEAHQQGFTIIDCQNKFLCPGLIDSHVHLMAVQGFADLSKAFGNPSDVSVLRQPYVCAQMLQRGFTAVRDCGGALLALKEAIQDGVFAGPHLFIAGHALSQSGGHADYWSQKVASHSLPAGIVDRSPYCLGLVLSLLHKKDLEPTSVGMKRCSLLPVNRVIDKVG